MKERETSPEWIEALLKTVVPSSRLRSAGRRAVERGAGLGALRLARKRLATRPTGVRAFLSDLADAGGFPPETVAGWAGVPEDPFDPSFGPAWGRFAADLGLDRREVLLHLRASLLTASGSGPIWMGMAARFKPPAVTATDPLADVERLLAAEVAELDADRRESLRRAEDAALTSWFGG
jgi:hypothetical protein